MAHYCITISRQYGSGGRTLGGMLSKRLGIQCFDKNIIKKASEDSGITEELFGKVDEYFGKVDVLSKPMIYTGELLPPDSKDFTSVENLFNYQAKAILDIARSQDCIIIGRCANFILQREPDINLLRVFIHADWDFRMQRASQKLSMSTAEIEKFLRKDDKRKMAFIKHFTGMEWTDATMYDLCLDAGRLGYDRCVDIILANLPERP